ncbi:putative outer membrane lipoprotein [Arthrobacter globiformis]|nr:putative outer membrane lipoprotein [Arthrobacter globiformis]
MLQFLVVAAAFAVIDAVWLKIMNPFYRSHIGELLADRPHLGYAVAFYSIYIAGIVFFALRPALDGGTWLTADGHGAAGRLRLRNVRPHQRRDAQDLAAAAPCCGHGVGRPADRPRHAGGLAGLPPGSPAVSSSAA